MCAHFGNTVLSCIWCFLRNFMWFKWYPDFWVVVFHCLDRNHRSWKDIMSHAPINDRTINSKISLHTNIGYFAWTCCVQPLHVSSFIDDRTFYLQLKWVYANLEWRFECWACNWYVTYNKDDILVGQLVKHKAFMNMQSRCFSSLLSCIVMFKFEQSLVRVDSWGNSLAAWRFASLLLCS